MTEMSRPIPPEQEGSPFHEPLEEGGFSYKIKKLKSNPNKLVREHQLKPINVDVIDPEEFKNALEHHRRGKRLFETLRERYGLHVPAMDLVVGSYESRQPTMFTVVDRIEGRSLAKLSKELSPGDKEDLGKKLDEFYTGLLLHYRDVCKEGGDYWTDFFNGQLVYGRRHGEDADEVYIVDVDPHFNTHRKDSEETGLKPFEMFSECWGAIHQAEEYFGIRMEKARHTLESALDEIPENEQLDWIVSYIKSQLNFAPPDDSAGYY
ncbi:MAG: hypothetical protein Q7S09_03105 [bacterium]|nr:hypothetical protein [bacterium]